MYQAVAYYNRTGGRDILLPLQRHLTRSFPTSPARYLDLTGHRVALEFNRFNGHKRDFTQEIYSQGVGYGSQ